MTDAREALMALLNSPGHAPMSAHDPRDGSCVSCPWPLHEMPPEDIADAILAAGWTPRGERVKPSVEDVARERLVRLAAEWDERATFNSDQGGGFWQGMTTKGRECADELRAVLALLPGRTESEVKAEAWDECARTVRLRDFEAVCDPNPYRKEADNE